MATPADFESFRIDHDDGLPIAFTGNLLCIVESSPDSNRSNWSGMTGRWRRLELYKTRAAQYICVCRAFTQWERERDSVSVEVVNEPKGIAEFFGPGWMLRQLCEQSGVDLAEHVE